MSEGTVNPNAFVFELQGKTCYADPLKVRRALLTKTMGKCWGLVMEVGRLKKEIEATRVEFERIKTDVETNPLTLEEAAKDAEINTMLAEGKQVPIPFQELPRTKQLGGYDAKIAKSSERLSDLEGILIEASFQAFNFPEFDTDTGEGVTELEAFQVLKLFLEYAEGKGERLGN